MRRNPKLTDAPVATDADRSPPDKATDPPQQTATREPAARVAEGVSTGTDGRVIAFPSRAVGTGTTMPASEDLFGLSSLKEMRVWRPVKFVRNRDYPKVIMDGCKFKQDSGGFALFQRTPSKYLGHYRKEAITELERKYGKKKSRRRKIDLAGLPKEIVAGVIIAQMYQAQSDARTHPDRAAGERIITATNLVLDLLRGYTTPQVVAAIPQIQEVLRNKS
jgi:hypothetical protein